MLIARPCYQSELAIISSNEKTVKLIIFHFLALGCIGYMNNRFYMCNTAPEKFFVFGSKCKCSFIREAGYFLSGSGLSKIFAGGRTPTFRGAAGYDFIKISKKTGWNRRHWIFVHETESDINFYITQAPMKHYLYETLVMFNCDSIYVTFTV